MKVKVGVKVAWLARGLVFPVPQIENAGRSWGQQDHEY